MKLIAILLILTSVYCVKDMRLHLAQHRPTLPDLKYYHRYEKLHGAVINPNIPLTQHYANERKLRQKADHIKDEITHLKHETGFEERDLDRKVLGLKNEENSLKSGLKADNRIAQQHMQAIKYDINHQERFRELYSDRLKHNTEKLKHALPDQVPALNELVKFDRERVKHWLEGENKNQGSLEVAVEKNLKEKAEVENHVAELEAKIVGLKAQVDNVKERAKFEVGNLESKEHSAEKLIEQDEDLDSQRRENEKIEANATDVSEVNKAEQKNKELIEFEKVAAEQQK